MDIGYHFVIKRDGIVEDGRPIDVIGSHCRGVNYKSIGICLVGGVNSKKEPENNFTTEQFNSLKSLLLDIRKKYPEVEILGHNEFSTKACPSFNVEEYINAEFNTNLP